MRKSPPSFSDRSVGPLARSKRGLRPKKPKRLLPGDFRCADPVSIAILAKAVRPRLREDLDVEILREPGQALAHRLPLLRADSIVEEPVEQSNWSGEGRRLSEGVRAPGARVAGRQTLRIETGDGAGVFGEMTAGEEGEPSPYPESQEVRSSGPRLRAPGEVRKRLLQDRQGAFVRQRVRALAGGGLLGVREAGRTGPQDFRSAGRKESGRASC